MPRSPNSCPWLFPHLRMNENGGHAAVRWLVGE